MIIAKKKDRTVYSVPFMGLDEEINGVLPDECAIQIRSTRSCVFAPCNFGRFVWKYFMTPAENLALMARSLEGGK